MKVSEAITPAVLTVTRDTPLMDAARLMRDSDVGPLPVSHDGRVVGVLTDRDITFARSRAARTRSRLWSKR